MCINGRFSSLANLRITGGGPPSVKIGGRVLYKLSQVVEGGGPAQDGLIADAKVHGTDATDLAEAMAVVKERQADGPPARLPMRSPTLLRRARALRRLSDLMRFVASKRKLYGVLDGG